MHEDRRAKQNYKMRRNENEITKNLDSTYNDAEAGKLLRQQGKFLKVLKIIMETIYGSKVRLIWLFLSGTNK